MAVTWVANSVKAYDTGQLTVTKPAGVQDDDLIVLVHSHDDASDHTGGWEPAGFTEIADSPWLWDEVEDPGANVGCAVAVKTASSEPATWVFNVTNTHNNEQQAAVAIILRGCDNADPIDATAQSHIDRLDTDTDLLHPSVNITSDGSFVICFGGEGHHSYSEQFVGAAGFPDIPASLSNEFYTDYLTDAFTSLVGASGAFDSGATGTLLFNIDGVTSQDISVQTIAINPSGGAAPRRVMVRA